MPRLSHFFGIDIFIPARESNHRLPHFHAALPVVEYLSPPETLEVLAGQLPAKELAMVRGWAFEHRDELLHAWEELKRGLLPSKIAPLE
jgi:hypothetical protein